MPPHPASWFVTPHAVGGGKIGGREGGSSSNNWQGWGVILAAVTVTNLATPLSPPVLGPAHWTVEAPRGWQQGEEHRSTQDTSSPPTLPCMGSTWLRFGHAAGGEVALRSALASAATHDS